MFTFFVERASQPSQPAYTVIHLLVVDVACVLFWTQSVCMVPHQNTRNIYHKQMNNGVTPIKMTRSKIKGWLWLMTLNDVLIKRIKGSLFHTRL